jgi:large subunit ribosomal protein L25
MAHEVTLKAQRREGTGRTAARKLKQDGRVPAVIYGHGDPENLQVSSREIQNVLSHAVGEHVLVALDVEGEAAAQHAIIQDVQHHPVSAAVLHVDFVRVRMNEAITSTIPVEPKGEPTGVKNQGGILEQSLRELEIEALPKDLPELIVVDVSDLAVGDTVLVKDLKLPPGVTALDDPELAVFVLAEPNVAVEEEAEEEAVASPEVLKEKPAEGGETKA